MGRYPCCKDNNSEEVKKGPWTPEEDQKLSDYVRKNGHGNWQLLPKRAGLNRCGKSCRLRWTNYLRPDIKRGGFSEEEEQIIINLHSSLGNKWSRIAAHLPGRTDNEIKNFWNTNLRKKLLRMGIDPKTHQPITDINLLLNLSHQMFSNTNNNNLLINPLGSALRLQNILQFLNSYPIMFPNNKQENNFPLGFDNNTINALNHVTATQNYSADFIGCDFNPDMKMVTHNDHGQSEYSLPSLVQAASENIPSLDQTIIPSPGVEAANKEFLGWEEFLGNEDDSSLWNDILQAKQM